MPEKAIDLIYFLMKIKNVSKVSYWISLFMPKEVINLIYFFMKIPKILDITFYGRGNNRLNIFFDENKKHLQRFLLDIPFHVRESNRFIIYFLTELKNLPKDFSSIIR